MSLRGVADTKSIQGPNYRYCVPRTKSHFFVYRCVSVGYPLGICSSGCSAIYIYLYIYISSLTTDSEVTHTSVVSSPIGHEDFAHASVRQAAKQDKQDHIDAALVHDFYNMVS